MTDRATTYLLPCSCGRNLRVEPRQAGETVRCECGLTCAVPTMRAVQNLRPASTTLPAEAKPAWGNPQRLLVAGLVIVSLAAISAVILYIQFPTHFAGLRPPEQERQFVKSLPPLETMRYFRTRILPGIELYESAEVQRKEKMVYLGMGSLAVFAAIGLSLVGVGVTGIMRRRS